MKYKRKSCIFDAMQINEQNETEVKKWSGGKVYASPVLEPTDYNEKGVYWQIDTPIGLLVAVENDWIIKESNGLLYPIKKKIFDEVFEPVNESKEKKLKSLLFELGNSHRKLSSETYNNDITYNNTHYSYAAEEKLIEYFRLNNMLDDFLSYIRENNPKRIKIEIKSTPPCLQCRNFRCECQISAGQQMQCINNKWIHFSSISGKDEK